MVNPISQSVTNPKTPLYARARHGLPPLANPGSAPVAELFLMFNVYD